MGRAVEPGAHQARRAVEGDLCPGERLAEAPGAAAAKVAGCADAVAQRRAAGGDVGEELASDHVGGMLLGRPRELRVLAHDREAAGGALRVDDAEERGTAVLQ